MNIDNENDTDITPNITPIKKSVAIVNSNSKIISSKSLTAKKWTLIEKPLPEADLKRNKIINDLGEKSSNMFIEIVNSSGLFTVGEINYLKIRDEVKDLLGLPLLEKTDKKDEKKLNKATKLKLENCQINLKNKIDILKNLLKDDNIQEKLYEDLMINFNYIEMRILVLMKLIDIITKKKTNSIFGKNIKEISLEEQNNNKEELLLASKKILHNLKIYKTDNFFKKICNIPEVDIVLSQILIDDFNFKIEQLSSQIDLKLYEIANKRPKLIFDTKYDITIPEMKLKPHDTQLELINTVKNNINNGFLIFYKTLPGLGKTSMILSICSFIKKSNELPKKKVIFCCSDILESVRVQVLRVMFNFGIKFGIGISSDESKYTIKNSWNCKNDDDRELIVCDYLSTYLILKEAKNDYLLFFDEPTVLTDVSSDTIIIKTLAKILYYLPKCTILSSATLPLLDEISDITNRFKKNYPESIIREITSNKILVGCTIKDFDDNIIVPHNYCNSSKDLELLLIKIKKYPLLGKFYTLPYLMNLNEFMKNYNLNIDLESIESFDQENIIENILLLLERVVCNNTIIHYDSFKSIQINDINENKYDSSKYDTTLAKIDYSKLLTTHAFKYFGCCLIATHNPLDFIRNNFYELIEKLKNKINIKNINHIYDKYIKDDKNLKEQIEAIQTKYTSENVIEEKINTLLNNKPKINFPTALQINTHEHIKNFAKYVKSYDDTLLKNVITPESIDISTYTIEEPVNFLLYMGIGIYCKNLPSDYTDLVLDMLSERQLAFIITDESFCYGANYQISNVIINDDLADNHSINTILQLIGRTSRIGKSWAGKVYLDTNTKKRLTEFFDAPNNDSSNEGKNITTAFNSIIQEIELEIKKDKELLEKKEKEKELYLEKKKAEDIKKKTELEELEAKKNQEQAAKINEDKNFWTSIRSNRVVDKSNIVVNEDITDKKSTEENTNQNRDTIEDITVSWGNLRGSKNTTATTQLKTQSAQSSQPTQPATNLYVPKERSRNTNLDKVNNTNSDFKDIRGTNKANTKKDNTNDKTNDKNSFEEIKNYFKRK